MTTELFLPAAPTELEARQQLARVPITQPPGLLGSAIGWLSRKMYGHVPDNGFALARNRKVLFSILGYERKVAKWNALPQNLQVLAALTAAGEIGCSWCVDFGYFVAEKDGLDLDKLKHLNDWRDSPIYTPLERRVVEYSIAMTATPPTVTDEMVAALRTDLGDAAVVELTAMIAVENHRSRMNTALGLVSQGFSASCQLPRR